MEWGVKATTPNGVTRPNRKKGKKITEYHSLAEASATRDTDCQQQNGALLFLILLRDTPFVTQAKREEKTDDKLTRTIREFIFMVHRIC
jgi:hypothetical protein